VERGERSTEISRRVHVEPPELDWLVGLDDDLVSLQRGDAAEFAVAGHGVAVAFRKCHVALAGFETASPGLRARELPPSVVDLGL